MTNYKSAALVAALCALPLGGCGTAGHMDSLRDRSDDPYKATTVQQPQEKEKPLTMDIQ